METTTLRFKTIKETDKFLDNLFIKFLEENKIPTNKPEAFIKGRLKLKGFRLIKVLNAKTDELVYEIYKKGKLIKTWKQRYNRELSMHEVEVSE